MKPKPKKQSRAANAIELAGMGCVVVAGFTFGIGLGFALLGVSLMLIANFLMPGGRS